MLNTKHRRMLSGFGLFLVPVVLVKLIGAVLGSSGPTSAQGDSSAATAAPSFAITAVKPVSFPQPVIAAAQYSQSLRSQPFDPSPFYYVSRVVAEPAPTEAQPVEGVDFETLSRMVQLIMSSPRGDVVLIDGRMIRVGEEIDGVDWLVESIDARKGTIVFREISSGRTMTHTVTPKLP